MCLIFFLASCNHDEESVDETNITQTGVWDDESSTWDNAIFTE